MKSSSLFIQIAQVATIVILCYACSQKPNPSLLFEPTTKQGNQNLETTDEVVQKQNVLLRENLLTQGGDTLLANLFGETIKLTRIKNTLTPGTDFQWWGSMLGDPGGYIIFARSGAVYAANMMWKNTLFQLRFVGNGVYQLRKIDQQKFRDEEPSDPYPKLDLKTDGLEDPCPNTDPPSVIDIMVAYTDDFRVAAGNKDNAEVEIYLAVHETNLSYFNSNVNHRVGIVHLEEVAYVESGNGLTDVNWAQSNPAIQSSRDAHDADIVLLWVNNLSGNLCGRAYAILNPVTTTFEPYAYCVVRRSCATGYYSFGHEIGHLMGIRHNCASDGTLTPYPYGHGYDNCSGFSWRTIMSTGSCTRLPYFSNPAILYSGQPMGTSGAGCQADNHQALNNSAAIVANFRCHSSNTGNIWMKDTWNDTGAEPDPATASEYMWISPYIWVRTAQDVSLLHRYQHENPEFGSTNWVYVKLNNGGLSTTGNLELYYANASISLNWQSDWTLMTSIPMSIAATSSKIAEYQWTSLPGTGHYCLLARWISGSDLMTFAEGIDINYNVRQNNNLAWRNLNIVDLVADTEDQVEMHYKPTKESIVEIKFDNVFPNQSFIPLGSVEFSFDEITFKDIQGKAIGTGFQSVGDNRFVITNSVARIENLGSGKDFTGKIKLKFKKTDKTPKSKYYCYVHQYLKDKNQKNGIRTIGGVGYQINLDYK